MAVPEPIYDAAVVGGGIVGLATALALSEASYRVALIEREPPRRIRGALGFDLRTVALTPPSVDFLRGLGGVDDAVFAAVDAMRVWEHDGSASLVFSGPGTLAFVAENSALTTRLWAAAGSRIDLFAASVTGLTRTPDGLLLAGPDLVARLVIGADGANSGTRRLAGAGARREPPYRHGPQRAIATVARASRGHGSVAYQRFGRSGPVALLPVVPEPGVGQSEGEGDGRCVAVVWSTSEAQSRHLESLSDETFCAALERETEGVLGAFDAVDRRLSFPVRQALTTDFNPEPGVLIVGDAARTLHPLAGQGVNLGLEDARAIAMAGAVRGDLGAPGRWRDFARQRRRRSKLMMASMRTLLSAYCGPQATNPWMRLARNACVRFIDGSSSIKAQLVREAMGLGPLAFDDGASS